MNAPMRFRMILDSVEVGARQTEALLFNNSRNFWEDIVRARIHRRENKHYWMFCVKWMRGQLMKATALSQKAKP